MSDCLQIRGATKRYPGGIVAVNGVSLTARCGTVTALLGPNGSGKSTLLAMAAGVLRPSSGVFLVAGLEVWGPHGGEARRLLGYMPQVEPFHPLLTGWENLALHASTRGAQLDRGLVLELAEELGLRMEALDRRVGGYSSGMKRKLALIAAVLHQPRVLLLDEPDSGLDPSSRRRLVGVLRRLARSGAAVVFTTHIGWSATYTDHVVFMSQGRVVAEGTPAGLVEKYSPWRLAELEAADLEGLYAELESLENVERLEARGNTLLVAVRGGPDVLAAIARAAARHGLRRLSAREPGIEDAFLAATGQPLEDLHGGDT